MTKFHRNEIPKLPNFLHDLKTDTEMSDIEITIQAVGFRLGLKYTATWIDIYEYEYIYGKGLL